MHTSMKTLFPLIIGPNNHIYLYFLVELVSNVIMQNIKLPMPFPGSHKDKQFYFLLEFISNFIMQNINLPKPFPWSQKEFETQFICFFNMCTLPNTLV